MNPRRSLLLSLATLGAAHGLPLVSTPANAQAATPARLRVVASFSILADMVRQVAGDAAEVTSLVGANADAHVFEPTPADLRQVASADLVVFNGLGFEGWIDRLVRASGTRGTVVLATQGLSPRWLGRAADPHAWQSLVHARRYVENIRAALVSALPAQAAAIDRRAADYTARIVALDHRARAAFEAVPADERRIVTSHDAFGYLAEAYGLLVFAPRGWTTAAEASAADVARLVRQLRGQRVRALFIENISDRRLIERIAQEAGAQLGGRLYSDALSAPGGEADTYLRLYEHNVQTLSRTLRAARGLPEARG